MPPAARVTDMHTCPMFTGPVPHVGGPILPPGAPTVLIAFLPAARVTDMLTCVGPPDIIVKGSMGVFINYLPAARMGDMTAHGGVIILGAPTVMIGEIGAPSPGAGGMGGVMAGLAMAGLLSPIDPNASAYGQTSTPGAAGGQKKHGSHKTGGTARQHAIVKAVNPTKSVVNCGNIIDAAISRLNGNDPHAVSPAGGDGTFQEIETRHNTSLAWHSSFGDAFSAVRAAGDGTTAIVGIVYSGGSASHVVVLNNDKGIVGILEAQNWDAKDPQEVITSVSRANARYNADGESNIGYGIIPSPTPPTGP